MKDDLQRYKSSSDHLNERKNTHVDERPSRLLENVNKQPYSRGPKTLLEYFAPKRTMKSLKDGA